MWIAKVAAKWQKEFFRPLRGKNVCIVNTKIGFDALLWTKAMCYIRIAHCLHNKTPL